MDRSSGILLHISSLPSPYGIGNFGAEAYRFADFLKEAKQKFWQMLPLGHTSYGDSPYQCFSSFAGNPYFIDLTALVEGGLLTESEILETSMGENAESVDFAKLYIGRYALLRLAFSRDEKREGFASFCEENEHWLSDYALFMALKNHFQMESWLSWEDEKARNRDKEALNAYKILLAEDIAFYSYLQFLFFGQWNKLKAYVNQLGIKIIGDVPIYVAMDSVDVWANKELFQFDQEGRPTKVSGVPPDYFCADGQLWGNPLYDWAKMKESGYHWWVERMKSAGRLFDVIRIDHFRGIESYYAIDGNATTARKGDWEKGPGMDLIGKFHQSLGKTEIIAEDLGFLTPEVKQLLEDSGYPGMKILQFAFDAREPGDYCPHNYVENSIVYTGTHDNTTMAHWFLEANPENVAYAKRYLGLNEEEGLVNGMIRGAFASNAILAMIPMQDYLGLGVAGRMNEPSTMGKNWIWRMEATALTQDLAIKIKEITQMYGRG